MIMLCGCQIIAEVPLIDLPSEIFELRELVIETDPDESNLETQRVFRWSPGYSGNFTEGLAELPAISLINRGAFSSEPMIRGIGFHRVATSFNGLRLPSGSPTRTHTPIGQFGGILYRSLEAAILLPSVTLGPPVTAGWIIQESNWDGYREDRNEEPFNAALELDWFPDKEGIQWRLFSSRNFNPLALKASLHGCKIGNYTSADGREVPSRNEDWGASVSLAGISGGGWFHSLDTVYRKQLLTENVSLPLDVDDGNFYALSVFHELPRDQDEWYLRIRYGFSNSTATLSNSRRGALPVLVEMNAETQAIHADIRCKAAMHGLGDVVVGIDTNHENSLAIRRRGPLQQDFIWPDIQYKQFGVFLESRSRSSENLTLRTGIRWDAIQSDARMAGRKAFGKTISSLYAEYSGVESLSSSRSDSVVSANSLLRYDLSEFFTCYAGAGSGAQTPPPTECYRSFTNALGGGFEVGNPALRPERKWELAMGAHFRRNRLSTQLDLFYFLVEDFIWRQAAGSTAGIVPLDPPQQVFSYRNVDTAFAGIELQGNLQISPDFRIPFSAQFVNAHVRQSGPDYKKGDSLPELPPAELRVSGIWDAKLNNHAVTVEWALRWIASRTNELPEINPLYGQANSYVLQDLFLRLACADSLSLQLGIRNLFNKLYTPYLTPPASTIRAASSDFYLGERVPGPGREWSASVSFKF